MKLLTRMLIMTVVVWVGLVGMALVLRSREVRKILIENPEMYCQRDEDCVLTGVNLCCGKKSISKKYYDPKEDKQSICAMICPNYTTSCRSNICQIEVVGR